MSARSLLVLLVLALAGPALAQTRYFEGQPDAQELERALRPQAPAAAQPGSGLLGRRGGLQFENAAPAERPKVGLMVNFAYNSAELTQDAQAVLDALGRAMNRLTQYRFQIEGHTDAVGSDAYNLTLSQRRAASVVQYLVRTHNIDPGRLAAVGFGKRRLRDPEQPTAGINRRVEVMNLGEV